MVRLFLFTSLACFMFFSAAQAAGLRFLAIPEDQNGSSIDAAVWSPCIQPTEEVQIRAFKIRAAPDCPITGEALPLIIISHGYGGWFLGHHDTAEALADTGFVVVAINHPHANYADMSRANGLPPLVERPRDIKRAIDFMLSGFAEASKIDPQRVGFYGFSQGGYTGLVIAGGNPDFGKLPRRCPDPEAAGCQHSNKTNPSGETRVIPVLTHDARVKAMVVSDPLSVVFQTKDSVKDIDIPIQLWGSERGSATGASLKDASILRAVLPDKPDFHIAPNAVHMSFLTMCPQANMSSEVCRDSPGFDRASFHKMFNAEVVAFFRKHLAP